MAVGLAAPAGGQTQGAGPLETLLGRAATTESGSYVVTSGALAPAPDPIPVFLQADVYRGAAAPAMRVAVALATEAPRGTVVRLRITSAPGPTGAPSRIVADTDVPAAEGRTRMVHEFTLEPGEYEVQAVVGHPRAGGFVAALAKSRLTVPDLWKGALAATPIVLGESASPTARAAEPRPFVFGPTALTPAARPAFSQENDLHVAFRIFNWKAEPGRKPDLTAEYTFYQQTRRRLSFFNKIKPQKLDAGALGESFDPAGGVVSAGMTVPLQSFPYGEFELKVRVTDNATRLSAERRVRFGVAP